MTKMQNPIYRKANTNRDVIPELQSLIKKRAKAKRDVDLQHK